MEIPTYFNPSQENSLRKYIWITLLSFCIYNIKKCTLVDLKKKLFIQLYQLIHLLTIFLENFNSTSKAREILNFIHICNKIAIWLPNYFHCPLQTNTRYTRMSVMNEVR